MTELTAAEPDPHDEDTATVERDPAFEPPIGRRELPDAVARARVRERELEERLAPLVEPRIRGWLLAHAAALDTLDEAHQRLADRTDIDLVADTRWAAVWQMSGRCLGFGRALLVLAREGFGVEALATARAVHESARMLEALTDLEEPDLLRRWLVDDDDDYVRPGHARAAIERAEARLDAQLREAGVEPPSGTIALIRRLYHEMSQAAHNRRSSTQRVVSVELRRMPCGRHPSAIGRAEGASTACAVIEECVQAVADALARFYGATFLTGTLAPMLESFEAVRREMPLGREELLGLV